MKFVGPTISLPGRGVCWRGCLLPPGDGAVSFPGAFQDGNRPAPKALPFRFPQTFRKVCGDTCSPFRKLLRLPQHRASLPTRGGGAAPPAGLVGRWGPVARPWHSVAPAYLLLVTNRTVRDPELGPRTVTSSLCSEHVSVGSYRRLLRAGWLSRLPEWCPRGLCPPTWGPASFWEPADLGDRRVLRERCSPGPAASTEGENGGK